MAAFQGFSTDKLIPLPMEFFTEVAPAIKNPVEMKVTLHIFYALSRKRGQHRRISWDELYEDALLQQSLRAVSSQRAYTQLLEEGLAAAVHRGTLLHIGNIEDGRARSWYLANTPANRTWADRQQNAQLKPSPAVPAEPPSIFTLYEQNIGLLSPLLAEELREAAERYPPSWIEEAIREAVRSNVRSWRYIRRILERWETHGRATAQNQPGGSLDPTKYISGKYAHIFRPGGDETDLSEM